VVFARDRAVSLVQTACRWVKESGNAPVFDVRRRLSAFKLKKGYYDVGTNNIFRSCRRILKDNRSKKAILHDFYSLRYFLDSFDLMSAVKEFVPSNAFILSNIPGFNSYTGRNLDMVLLGVHAVSENSVVLDNRGLELLALAHKRDIPVYAVASVFSIDKYSVYSPGSLVPFNLFAGVISENRLESFDSFLENSQDLFF